MKNLTYLEIIENFIKKKGSASSTELYSEVRFKRKNLPKYWKNIVRGVALNSEKLKKEDDRWKFK